MVRLGTLLRRSPRHKDQPEVEAPAQPGFLGPPLMVLIPDVAGVSSFRLYTFPDSEAATAFVLSLSRQQRERAHAFWALQDEPAGVLDGDDATGEATVLIRASEGSDLVYVVSFVDIESAQSFARFEVKRGMHLGLMLVYWASMVNVVLTEDRVQLVPEFPPRIDRRPQHTRARTSETHKLRPPAEAQEADASVSLEQKNGHQAATAPDSTQAEVEAEEQRRLAAEAEAHRRIAAEAAELRELLAEEEEKQRIAAQEEQRRLEAEAAEQKRVEAETAEQRRIAAEAEEKRRLAAQEEEQRRLEAEAAEQQRVEAEAAEQRRIAAEAEEKRRLAAQEEEQRRLEAEAAEQQRMEAEAEQRRLAAEAEEQRLLAAEVEEKRRLEAEAAEERRLEAEAEAEQQRRVEAEAQEQQRIAAQAEEWRRQAEAEDSQRQRLEAEERANLEAEAEERLRQAAETQAERDRAAEAEMQRLREAIVEEQRRLDAEADVGHGDLPAHDSELDREAEEAAVGMQAFQQSDEISEELSQPTEEVPNPIEELLEQEAQTRAQIPHEFAKYIPPDGVEPAVENEDDANIADEVGKILRRRRWDKRESPFEGFNSPPGRF